MVKAIALCFLLALCGCLRGGSGVPANRITLKTPRGSYDILTPKNVAISNFKASVDTNGAVQIAFEKWSSTNDPLVIDKAAAGQAAIVNAWSGLMGTVAAKAAEGAAKGAVP